MKENLHRAFSLAAFLFLVIAFPDLRAVQLKTQGAEKPAHKGEVIAVLDGDTIMARFDGGEVRTLRLIGIDTPELHDLRDDVKWLALTAKRYAFWRLYKKDIELTYDWTQEDKHGRMLAYVWAEGVMFNKSILKDGFATAFLKFPFKHSEEFKRAEEEARKLERGFWREKPYPSITADGAERYLGELMEVRFLCSEVSTRGKYCFLDASAGEFTALLMKKDISLFPDINSFAGKLISVTGLLEDYRGKPQIMVFFPWQIKVLSQREE